MSEEIELTFKMEPDEQEKINYTSTIRALRSIPDVKFTPQGGLFDIGDTIKGVLKIPDAEIEPVANAISRYLLEKEKTKGKRKVIIKTKKGTLVLNAQDSKKGETAEAIKEYLTNCF
jgi:hypothetical protein